MALVQILQAQGRVLVTVFQLQDRIHLGNYQEMEQIAKDAYDKGMRGLLIDLSQTPSRTSIGIRALVVIHKMLGPEASKHFRLASPMKHICEMLESAGVTASVEICDTVEEAVASL